MAIKTRLIVRGQLGRYMDLLPVEGAKAVQGVIRNKTRAVQRGIRRDISRAGLGTRLGNALRSNVFPRRGNSMRARGTVFSNAIVNRQGQQTDLITLFDQGALIQPRNRRFLAIPTAEAGVRKTPAQWPRGSLIVISGRRAPYLATKEEPRVPLFILVRNVRIRKRIDVARVSTRILRNTATLIARSLDRRASNLARKLGGV